jgi:hypothetical protein
MEIKRNYKRTVKGEVREVFFIRLNGDHRFWIWRTDREVTKCREHKPNTIKDNLCDAPPMLVEAIKNQFDGDVKPKPKPVEQMDKDMLEEVIDYLVDGNNPRDLCMLYLEKLNGVELAELVQEVESR